MSLLFVAGAGTDVGKTYVTTALVRRLRADGRAVVALKPVASGVPAWGDPAWMDTDTARLLDAQGLPLTRETVDACTPWRFAAPLAPDMAAARERRTLTLDAVMDFCRRAVAAAPAGACVIIEGVGGVMSPLTVDATGLDWIRALACPVLLVGGDYLGAISHTLTACETLTAHGARLVTVAVSEGPAPPVPLAETVLAVARRAPTPVVGIARGAAWEGSVGPLFP